METHAIFAQLAWISLLLVMFIRPVTDILGWKLLKRILRYRKQIAVFCGLSAILHVIIYMLSFNVPVSVFWNFSTWSFSNFFTWGIIAFLVMIPLFMTSNKFSMLLLKRNWKRLQRLSYIMFVAVALHIYFLHKEIAPLIMVAVWLGLFFWAKMKRK